MCGWSSEAAKRASAWNRRRNAASTASVGCSSLTATRRPSPRVARGVHLRGRTGTDGGEQPIPAADNSADLFCDARHDMSAQATGWAVGHGGQGRGRGGRQRLGSRGAGATRGGRRGSRGTGLPRGGQPAITAAPRSRAGERNRPRQARAHRPARPWSPSPRRGRSRPRVPLSWLTPSRVPCLPSR